MICKYSLVDRTEIDRPIHLRYDAVAEKPIEIAEAAGRIAACTLKGFDLRAG
jgi:hypothetical protein